jgi:hypothetical protein
VLGSAQTTDFNPLLVLFSPYGAKKEPKKESKYHATVRPELVEGQARITFA